LRSGGSGVEIDESSAASGEDLAESGQGQSAGDSSLGGSTAQGSTTQQAAVRVAVDGGRCTACGRCLQACPQGVFAFDSGSGTAMAASPDACTLCGRCVQVCPPRAITLNA
jgi:NAD-dependent dihydropyrimidine dehydrogenase PreA subunit